jgi:type II secretory pathway pseudopilin PulG
MRRGATLLELLVAMSLATIVLATASRSVLRQRRSGSWLTAHFRSEQQLRAGATELSAALMDLAPGAGDLSAGETRDTALQVREAMATGFACDSAVAEVALVLDDGAAALTAVAAMPKVGDSLWWYRSESSTWSARRITGVGEGTASCGLTGQGAALVLRIVIAGADSVARGAPLRVTRQARYSIYKGGDGSWQLGLSEWSDTTHRFAAPQPIAGPFVRGVAGGPRTGFRYFDSAGVELPASSQAADLARMRRVRVTVLSADESPGARSGALLGDSIDVAFTRLPAP